MATAFVVAPSGDPALEVARPPHHHRARRGHDMYDQLHLRDYADRVAQSEQSRRRQWSRPPRPPSSSRRALASALRAAADAVAPAPDASARRA